MKFKINIELAGIFLVNLVCLEASILIETSHDQTDFQCDFYNQTLNSQESIWFVRSPYNCRVYHLCAFKRQFTLTCALGLYFDDQLDSCNFESMVDCQPREKSVNNLYEYDAAYVGTQVTVEASSLAKPTTTAPLSHLIPTTTNFNYYYNDNYDISNSLLDDTSLLDNQFTDADKDITKIETNTIELTTPIQKLINAIATKSQTISSTQLNLTNYTAKSVSTTTSGKVESLTSETTTASSTMATALTSTNKIITSWYQPFSPITFLLFTYKSKNSLLSHSKKSMNSDVVDIKNYDLTYSNENRSDEQQTQPQLEYESFNFKTNRHNRSTFESSKYMNENLNYKIENLFESFKKANVTLNETNELNGNELDAWWLAPKKCMLGFDHKMSNKENCAHYYECNGKDGTKTIKSCPYPFLFDEYLNECRQYDLVDCGDRMEPKTLCDYNLSNKESTSSLSSNETCDQYPSCKNLTDGLYPSNDCLHYFQCKDERTLRQMSCPLDSNTGESLRFNIITRRCDTIQHVPTNCGGYAIQIDIKSGKMLCPQNGLLRSSRSSSPHLSFELKDIYYSHPFECNLFIECDKHGNVTVMECPKNTHFSPIYQSCVHPSISTCKATKMIDSFMISSTIAGATTTTTTKSNESYKDAKSSSSFISK